MFRTAANRDTAQEAGNDFLATLLRPAVFGFGLLRPLLLTTAIAAAAISPTATVLANDSVAELGAGGIVLARTGIVSIERERLFISLDQVRVDYEFVNNSRSAVKTLVAFPMPDYTASPFEAVSLPVEAADNFMDFSVSVDGNPVSTNLQQRAFAGGIDVTDQLKTAGVPLLPNDPGVKAALAALDSASVEALVNAGIVVFDEYDAGNGPVVEIAPVWTLKSAYWWEMEFPPGKVVRVHHEYRPGVGGSAGLSFVDQDGNPGYSYKAYQQKYCIEDGFFPAASRLVQKNSDGGFGYTESWISYVLTTGANWAGTIRNFELVIDKGTKQNLVSFCGSNVEKTGPTEFTMRITDFVPERDLDVLFMIHVRIVGAVTF